MANQFEQVDAPVADAISLVLRREGDFAYGVVECPASAGDGKLPRDFSSGDLPIKEAFRSAIRLGNELKIEVVVVDPDGLWDKDWGALYRVDDAGNVQT